MAGGGYTPWQASFDEGDPLPGHSSTMPPPDPPPPRGSRVRPPGPPSMEETLSFRDCRGGVLPDDALKEIRRVNGVLSRLRQAQEQLPPKFMRKGRSTRRLRCGNLSSLQPTQRSTNTTPRAIPCTRLCLERTRLAPMLPRSGGQNQACVVLPGSNPERPLAADHEYSTRFGRLGAAQGRQPVRGCVRARREGFKGGPSCFRFGSGHRLGLPEPGACLQTYSGIHSHYPLPGVV